jgi:hypothetical protein
MTPVHFDAETATLALDRETFAALVAYAAQPTGDAAHLAQLREAGAYRGSRSWAANRRAAAGAGWPPRGSRGRRPRARHRVRGARWQAVMRWLPAPGSAGQRAVQVIDTASGLLAVEPGGTGLAVWPR